MKKNEPLSMRIYHDPEFTDLARAAGYVGIPARELDERVRDLTAKHGVRKLSAALLALTTFEGNRVMLSKVARPRCGMLLGPPLEKQLDYWQDVKPECRPKGWDQVPEVPALFADPLMESLYRLGPADLNARLGHERRRADQMEMIAIESEMLRRGMKPPPEEAEPPKKKPARKRKTG